MDINFDAIETRLEQLMKLFVRYDVKLTPLDGDALLTAAAICHEKQPGGKEAFLARAAALWDAQSEAGQPDAQSARDMVGVMLEVANPHSLDSLKQFAATCHDKLSELCMPLNMAFVLHLVQGDTQVGDRPGICIANVDKPTKLAIVGHWFAWARSQS